MGEFFCTVFFAAKSEIRYPLLTSRPSFACGYPHAFTPFESNAVLIEWFLLNLLLGAVMGVLSGALGIGGGSVIVQGLLIMFTRAGFDADFSMQMTLATSLAAIILTSIGAMRAHGKRGSLRWSIVKAMAPAVALGAFLGAFIAAAIPGYILVAAFGVFMVFLSVQMFWSGRKSVAAEVPEHLPKPLVLTGFGAGIGVFSSFFGIGGGTITVPLLNGFGVRMQEAAAVSSACGLAIAITGTIGFIMAGWGNPELPAYSVVFVYLPAAAAIILTSYPMTRVGVNIAHRLPGPVLKRLFGLLLGVVGLRMLLG